MTIENYPKRLSPRDKAAARPKSASLAIAAYCYHDCNNEEAANSHLTKVAIRDCSIKTCSLWPRRPWQKITGGNTKPRTIVPIKADSSP